MSDSPPYPAVFEGYEQKRAQLRKFVQRYYVTAFDLQPCKMLDAGCGEGFWGDLFHHEGFQVSGFDREAAYIEAGREKYPHLELSVACIEDDLPYPEASFPLIFVRAISHFYAETLDGAEFALRNVGRYLTEDGLLLVSAYTDGSGQAKRGSFGDYLLHHHPVKDLTHMVADAGFEIQHVTRHNGYLGVSAK